MSVSRRFSKILVFLILFSSDVKLLAGVIDTLSNSKERSLSFNTSHLQTKDALNYGLVFSGIGLGTTYEVQTLKNDWLYNLKAELTIGLLHAQGTGILLQIEPITFSSLYRFSSKLALGTYFSSQISWQLYPEIQSGHMAWLTNYQIGPKVHWKSNLISRPLELSFSSSLLSLTSRPSRTSEEYFYTLKARDFISNAHANMQLHSISTMQTIQVGVAVGNTFHRNLGLKYELDYQNFVNGNRYRLIVHQLGIKWIIE